MKTISIWASKNQKLAIAFIIIIELLRGAIGFAIGNDFLPMLSNATIELMVLFIVFIISFVQINYRHQAPELSKETHHKFRLKNSVIILLGSFLLAILSGNHFKNLGHSTDNQLISYAGVKAKTDSIQQQQPLTVFEKSIKQKYNFNKKGRFFSKQTTENNPNDTGRRIGYVLLFMLSLLLTYLGLSLSCSIACSGYGVLAVLAFLLTLGILSGGIYLLIKSLRTVIKSRKEMTHEEKKKEWKRFFSIWGIVTAVITLFVVVANILE